MAKRFLNYTIGDDEYGCEKFNSVSGSDDYTSIDDPVDNRIPGLLDPVTDRDPLVFSYMNEDEPEVLLCKVSTPTENTTPSTAGITDNPLISVESRYTVCVPDVNSDGKLTWKTLKDSNEETVGQNIHLVFNASSVLLDVAGNPHGIVKLGDYLYIVDYDATKIYYVDLATLKATPAGSTCAVSIAIDLSTVSNLFPQSNYHHGTALIALPDAGGNIHLFALYSNTNEDSQGNVLYQDDSTLIRLKEDSDGDDPQALLVEASIAVGPNSTGLHPFGSGEDTKLLIPAIGGIQKVSETNGTLSRVVAVTDAFAALWNAGNVKQIVVGDGEGGGDSPPPVEENKSYDIHDVAVSEDGSWAVLVTMSYDTEDYLTCWRIYVMNLLALLTPGDSIELSDLVDEHLLVPVDSGFDEPTSYYCEAVYQNAKDDSATDPGVGWVWFLIGNRIWVRDGRDYTYEVKEISAGSGGSLYSPAFNLNSADLIGEMIYQASKNTAVNTRLGRLRGLAKGVEAAKATAAARAVAASRAAPPPEEEEGKEGK